MRGSEPSDAGVSDHRPLRLIKSETIPPAPNPTKSGSAVIDWLPDFAGHSWVAYGASSLLVISHFPSPLSPRDGPIFRQVFELFSPSSADVAAVSWSPADTCAGDLAAAAADRIFIFQYDSGPGSFCWSHSALLLQCSKVEAIAWTGSGDGIVSVGTEVILWKRNIKDWEIAWKSRLKVSQTLVAVTWSLKGPSATGAFPTELPAEGLPLLASNASQFVNVFQKGEKFGYVTSQLRHPQPVVAMEWRPSGGSQLNRCALYTPKQVLLTSCLDGAVRLWSEIDDSKTRKTTKDNQDPSASGHSFCVVAVIEINQSMGGTLGTDIFLHWALEVEGLICVGGGDNQSLCADGCENDEVGRCEWLIGFGPSRKVAFWAVHCFDDISTMRSPRITLWKRLELEQTALRSFGRNNEGLHFEKVGMWRNQLFGPPDICSLVQLVSCNSLAWSLLYSQSSLSTDESSITCGADRHLSYQSEAILDAIGHTGKIIQVAVHPFECEVEFAASLDSNGLLILWSIGTKSSGISILPTFNPSWQHIGQVLLQDIISQGTCLLWAPSLLDKERILLVKHVQGIDLLIVRNCQTKEETTVCHKLCTIPFIGHDHINSPDKIFSVPLRSSCAATFKFNEFLLLGLWMHNWQVESWKVTLHSCEISGKCCKCNFATRDNESGTWIYSAEFGGKGYCIVVDPCLSYLPDVQDQITSAVMVCPSIMIPSTLESLDLVSDYCLNNFPYHMVTGHSDGRSRFWKICLSDASVTHSRFELVGMLNSLQGPITVISVADCGQKIATICPTAQANNENILYIWEPLRLACVGTIEVQDKICLKGNVVGLHWFRLEGILFLGVCFENELHIYSQRVCCGQNLFDVKASESSTWVHIATAHNSSTISDFLLGHRATFVIVHEKYFSLFSQWSVLMDEKDLIDDHSTSHNTSSLNNEMAKYIPELFTRKFHIFGELSGKSSQGSTWTFPFTKVHNDKPGCPVANGILAIPELKKNNCFLKLTEVAERLCGPLPVYHPEALLMNIYSGNWKRAYVAVCHLVECLASDPSGHRRLISSKSDCSVGQVKLSSYFEGQLSNGESARGFEWSKDVNTVSWSSHSDRSLTQLVDTSIHDTISSFFPSSATSSKSNGSHEMLEKLRVLASVTDSQKMKMLAVVDLLREISNSQTVSAYGSLDEPGRRFWCAIRLQQLEFRNRYSRMPSTEELVVDSNMIGWAFHSDCQANLFSSILLTEPTWEEMRKMGVGLWFSNPTDLRAKMEKLARCQYLKNKDPKACALLYVALNRLQVLAGLFKLSKDEKDKPLVAFLSRNFQDEKHKAAALKNAYVLMGRHQFELAIAFLLLGGDISSAVTVCAKTLGDEQLAIVICRLVEGQGGPSERRLVSKTLLPAAIDKGDFWLASILEWISGNYLQSFLIVLGLQRDSHASESEKSFEHAAFQNPSVGQYCLMLAAKSSLKNAVGEHNAAILCRWAAVMTASAFNKHGLPLEALECLSSSACNVGVTDKGTNSANSEVLPGIIWPYPADSFSWLSHEVSSHLEYQVKVDLALQYIMKLMREHPCWFGTSSAMSEASACSQEQEMSQYQYLLENFEEKLCTALIYFEQKFSLSGDLLLKKVFVSLDDDRLMLIGYHLLRGSPSHVHLRALIHISSSSQLLKHAVNTVESVSYLLSRFVTASSIGSSRVVSSAENDASVMEPYCSFQYLELYLESFISTICSLRAFLAVLYDGSSKGLFAQSIIILDLCDYCIYFASAMLQHNIKALSIIVPPLLVSYTDGNYEEIDVVSLREILGQAVDALHHQSSGAVRADVREDVAVTHGFHRENEEDRTFMIPEDEKWIVLWTFLWLQLSKFIKSHLHRLSDILNLNSASDVSALNFTSSSELDDGLLKHVGHVMTIFIEALRNSSTQVSSHAARQLAIFFWKKAKDETPVPKQTWLEEFIQSNSNGFCEHLYRILSSSELSNQETSSLCSELLAKICADPKIISEMLSQLPVKLSQLSQWKPVRRWNQLNIGVLGEHGRLESYKQEGLFYSSSQGSHSAGSEQSHNLLDSGEKGAPSLKKILPFYNPREIYRRNGELLEALCINSIQQKQAAVASNKKGINFFHWGDALTSRDLSRYIWSKADWPRNGWAGTDSTPVPTCVSPGVGLARDKGSHLGLGGATVGVGSQTRAGKDLKSYAGLGWEIQEDFDNSIDPPATLDNINARTLASHPTRPFFLVGSYNTHIYLWEFGEEKVTATYGVLPAANVPPPYALASITALQFDRCGHRFANSASDGTVCTWQLEVGGRSNVRPTDACVCFNGHASDLCYVAATGSIIAASGYSSNGVNVVVWDTLAPPTSSRASVMCHEGGACSIAVFDNDMGTSSISPLIVTGGKEGDVGLHDFRYIATGKTKRNRHSNTVERITDIGALDVRSELSSRVGDQNRHGMLWYIPKAHSGSITKIATIPNTSFFLTGSKDGDVKLWDARRASLVFHWPRLHERHTFLQRSSQGFGGMSRVGVTDIQVITDGFLTCGGDGSVKLVQLNNCL